MAESSSVSKTFPRCPICLELFTVHRLLSCRHTLCYECLRVIITRAEGSGQFECPCCRKTEQIPPNGADGFPRKMYADKHEHSGQNTDRGTRYRAQLELQKAKKNQLHCHNLKDGTEDCGQAERFCIECCEYYCESCSDAHRRVKVCRTHEQVPVAEITEEIVRAARAKSEIPTCPNHKDEKLKLYCNHCRRAVCPICCHTSHHSHTFQEMAKVDVKEFKVELEKTLETLTNMKDEVEQQSKMENDSQAKLEASVSSAKKTVGNTVRKVCQMLNQKSEQITLKLNKKVGESETKVAARNKDLSNYKERVESLEASVKSLLKKGTMYNRLDSLPGIRKRLQGLQASPLPPGPVTGEVPSSSEFVAENLDGLVFQEEFKLSGQPGPTGRGALKVKVTCCFEWEKERSGDVPQEASRAPQLPLDQSDPSPADPQERTVIVEGFDPNTTPDILDNLLQKCLAVDPVEGLSICDNRAEVVLSSTEHVNKLLESPPRVGAVPLKVSRMLTPLVRSKTVTVEGCGLLKEKIVKLFFTNKKKSGGGLIEEFQMDSPRGVARITFCNQIDAEEVVGRGPQKLGDCTLNAKMF